MRQLTLNLKYEEDIEEQLQNFCNKHDLDRDSLYPIGMSFNGLESPMTESVTLVGNDKLWEKSLLPIKK